MDKFIETDASDVVWDILMLIIPLTLMLFLVVLKL
jgi:hypothetical protein